MLEVDKHEADILVRSLIRTIVKMGDSRFTNEDDPHLVKCETLLTKIKKHRAEL